MRKLSPVAGKVQTHNWNTIRIEACTYSATVALSCPNPILSFHRTLATEAPFTIMYILNGDSD